MVHGIMKKGIMDHTHLRYFTDKSFKKQLNNQNLNYSIINSKKIMTMSLRKNGLKILNYLKIL